jgi:hypothetical protein
MPGAVADILEKPISPEKLREVADKAVNSPPRAQ